MENKKSIMGPVISVFIMILIISILAGLTFLFVAQLKTNALDNNLQSYLTANETTFVNSSGVYLANYSNVGFRNVAITELLNGTDDAVISTGNITLTSAGFITNSSALIINPAKVSYTFTALSTNPSAYSSVNKTEAAGSTVVNYLPLIFLAIIFGGLLTLVLKFILPYINLGQSASAF